MLMKLDTNTRLSEISYMGATVTFRYFAPGAPDPSYYLLRVKDNFDKAKHEVLIEGLKEAVNWYVYVRSIEAKVEKIGYMYLEPFSEMVELAELLANQDTGEHPLNFSMGAKGFKDLDSALRFMHKELGIPEGILFAEQTLNWID